MGATEKGPATSSSSSSPSSRQTRPRLVNKYPGGSDTGGTASPWSGTHNSLKPRTNAATILAGVALATLLVGTFIVVKVKNSERGGEVFGDAGAHARSAVGVSELPLNAPVEVELIVEIQ